MAFRKIACLISSCDSRGHELPAEHEGLLGALDDEFFPGRVKGARA